MNALPALLPRDGTLAIAHGQATRARILAALVPSGTYLVRALGDRLRLSPSTMRRHLRQLEAEGLVVGNTYEFAGFVTTGWRRV